MNSYVVLSSAFFVATFAGGGMTSGDDNERHERGERYEREERREYRERSRDRD